MQNYILIGGGLTNGKAALTLLENGVTDTITLITNEPYYPYERPGLSKGYLQGKEDKDSLYASLKSLKDYSNFKIITQTNVEKIDPQTKTVSLSDNRTLPYDKILLATGARPRKLDIDDSANPIYYFRNIDDVNKIKAKIKQDNCHSAIVIGASFIGMEVAASLTILGLKVTVLHRGKLAFEKLDSPALSQKFIDYYQQKGVEFVFEDETATINSSSITTKKGQEIQGDIIIAGVGVIPNLELAQLVGLEIDEKSHGVVVNEQFQTSQPDIWAGGDIAYFPDEIAGHNRRLEHWDSANDQGEFIAHQMLGSSDKYKHLAYFFSDIFDLSFEFFGDSTLSEKQISLDHWTPEKASFIQLYLNEYSVLVAAFVMNSSDQARDKVIQAIETHQIIDDKFSEDLK